MFVLIPFHIKMTTLNVPYETVAYRINTLPQGKVLDVSNVRPDGTGVRVIDASSVNPSSGLVAVPGLPIVSNNYQSYRSVTDVLGPPYTTYADRYQEISGARTTTTTTVHIPNTQQPVTIQVPHTQQPGTTTTTIRVPGTEMRTTTIQIPTTQAQVIPTPIAQTPTINQLVSGQATNWTPQQLLYGQNSSNSGWSPLGSYQNNQIRQIPQTIQIPMPTVQVPQQIGNFQIPQQIGTMQIPRQFTPQVSVQIPQSSQGSQAFNLPNSGQSQVTTTRVTTPSGTTTTTTATTRPTVPRNINEAMSTKLNSLGPNQVLDVSSIRPDGTGIRVIDQPRGTRTTKVGVPGVAVVSDNYASYAMAINALGPEYGNYTTRYEQMYGEE